MKHLITMLVFFASLSAHSLDKPGKKGPPPEALAACETKAASDKCSFSKHDRTFSGICGQPKPELPLSCRPERKPKPQG